VRQARGSVLAGAPGGRIGGLGLAVVAFAALLLLVLWLASHSAKHWTLTPPWLTLGGTLALIFSAVILYLFGRYAGQRG
jgi:protein-S-isoprenylcysteine O-methyltransferase Ste14